VILTGYAIRDAVRAGDITIDPWDERLVNPASVDLRLGTEFAVYRHWVLKNGYELAPLQHVHDVQIPPVTDTRSIAPNGLVLRPGILYLLHSAERVGSRKYVGVLDGKSSLARLGISVHLTAGYFDPGYVGHATMEVTVVHPIRVYAGMRFAQMRYHVLEGIPMDYQAVGHYVGDHAVGPVPSRAYLQFRETKTEDGGSS
jgi:dCTP deaminase